MLVASLLWATYTVAGLGPVSRYGALRLTTWALWIGTPVLVVMGIPSLSATDLSTVSVGAWLGGFLHDVTGSYTIPFMIAFGNFIASVAMV